MGPKRTVRPTVRVYLLMCVIFSGRTAYAHASAAQHIICVRVYVGLRAAYLATANRSARVLSDLELELVIRRLCVGGKHS